MGKTSKKRPKTGPVKKPGSVKSRPSRPPKSKPPKPSRDALPPENPFGIDPLADISNFRQMLDNTPTPTFLQINSKFAYLNSAALGLFGARRPQDLLGHNALETVHPRFHDVIRKRIREVREGKQVTISMEQVFLRLDGSEVEVEVFGFPLEFGGEHGGVVFAQDISARKRAERAVDQSVRRFKDLIDAAPYGAHQYELKPGGKLVFILANRAAEKILKVDHSRFIGLTIEEAFPPLKDTPVPEACREVARAGQPYKNEQVEYTDNEIRGVFEILAFQTGPNRMAVFFRDVTER